MVLAPGSEGRAWHPAAPRAAADDARRRRAADTRARRGRGIFVGGWLPGGQPQRRHRSWPTTPSAPPTSTSNAPRRHASAPPRCLSGATWAKTRRPLAAAELERAVGRLRVAELHRQRGGRRRHPPRRRLATNSNDNTRKQPSLPHHAGKGLYCSADQPVLWHTLGAQLDARPVEERIEPARQFLEVVAGHLRIQVVLQVIGQFQEERRNDTSRAGCVSG